MGVLMDGGRGELKKTGQLTMEKGGAVDVQVRSVHVVDHMVEGLNQPAGRLPTVLEKLAKWSSLERICEKKKIHAP
jgi:hypothetical protein